VRRQIRRRSLRPSRIGRVGSSIYFGRRTLRVIGKRDDEADQPPVLIVEDA
jgi:hypothetical protein